MISSICNLINLTSFYLLYDKSKAWKDTLNYSELIKESKVQHQPDEHCSRDKTIKI